MVAFFFSWPIKFLPLAFQLRILPELDRSASHLVDDGAEGALGRVARGGGLPAKGPVEAIRPTPAG